MDPAHGGDVMRLTDLRNKKIKTLDGKILGRIHDVHIEGGRVVALSCGAGGFVERLTAKSHGRRIAWECVVSIAKGEVRVLPERQQGKPRASASRSRQGTRRPSGRRSKR
jgi:sporulation protein YlmC with PRC-barrel domain